MATTVANFGIGLSMQTSGIVQPLHHAGAAIGSFSQQVSGLYLPASEASKGFGVLEDAMELLALRAIATETSLANLIHTTGRIAGASRTARSASQQNTVVLQREAAAVTNISALRDRLIATLSRAPAGRPRLINTDADIQDIMRLRREIDLIQNEHPVRRGANRAVSDTATIDARVADLQARARSTSAQMSGQTPELLRQANVLLEQRAAIEARLNSQLDETISDAERIRQANAAINDVLTRRSTLMNAQVAAHRNNLRMAEQQSRPQSLGNQRAEYARITAQIDASVVAEERLNQAATLSGNTQEQNTTLAARATAETERRNGLMARQRQLQGDILTAQQGGIDARRMGNRLMQEQNRAARHAMAMQNATPVQREDLERQLAIRNQVNAKMQVFNANLRDQVRYQGLSVERARQLSREYRAQELHLAGMNTRIRQAAGGIGRAGFAMQNFGYAIEDAASQWGTRGLAGAIGAASNNISAMAIAFNSIRLQVGVSIGVALLQLAVQTGVLQKALVFLNLSIDDTNAKTKELAKTFDVFAASQNLVIDHQKSLEDIMATTTSEALTSKIRALRMEYDKLAVSQQKNSDALQDLADRDMAQAIRSQLQRLTMYDAVPGVDLSDQIQQARAELFVIQDRIDHRMAEAEMVKDAQEMGKAELARQKEVNALRAEGLVFAEKETDIQKALMLAELTKRQRLAKEIPAQRDKNDLARTELGEAANDPKVGQQNLATIIAHKEESIRLDERAVKADKELADSLTKRFAAEKNFQKKHEEFQKAEAKSDSPGAGRPSLEAEADEARLTILGLTSKRGEEALSAEEEQVLAGSKRVLAAWRQHYRSVDGATEKARAAMEEADALRAAGRQDVESKQEALHFAKADQGDRGKVKVELNRELLRTKTELQRIETELQEQEDRGVRRGDAELTRQKRMGVLLGEQATAQTKLNTLTKAGESAREKADKTLGSLAGGLSKEIKKEQDRARAAKDFREELERASELGMQPDQVRERLAAFDTLNEKTDERDKLLKEKESLKKDLSERDKPATQQSAVEAGSAEAARIVADAILGGMNEKENQPLIDAMLKNKEALDLIESAIRDIPVLNIQVAG